jgi:hypothetical protein
MFKITNSIAHIEQDSYEHGCSFDGALTQFDTSELIGGYYSTVSDIVAAIKLVYGSDCEPELNACEENGRIDAQFMSTSKNVHIAPKSRDLNLFKTGERVLWLWNMSLYVVDTKPELKL